MRSFMSEDSTVGTCGDRARPCANASRIRRSADVAESDSCKRQTDIDATTRNLVKLEKRLAKAKLRMDYDLTLQEIVRRLKAEKMAST